MGGEYEHANLRNDHHQRGFFETFDGDNALARDGGRPDVTGPASATGAFKTKLSASGLVYKHYGQEIICELHPSLRDDPDSLVWVYTKMYKDFMEGIDAIDNGVEIADVTRYREGNDLSRRVARLNAWWNAPPGGPSEDERFEGASTLCGAEFASALDYIVRCELPARNVVEKSLLKRHEAHSSGEVLLLSNGGACSACRQINKMNHVRARCRHGCKDRYLTYTRAPCSAV